MSRGALLKRLKSLGILRPCIRAGLIQVSVLRDLDVQERVESLQRSGMGKNQAVLQVSAELNLHRSNVYRILASLS